VETQRKLIQDGKERLLAQGLGEGSATSAGASASLLSGPEGEVGRKVLQRLKPDAPAHLDDLVDNMEGCSASELIAALFELEMLGLAKQLPGKNFVRVW
jgi:DNA processing protein